MYTLPPAVVTPAMISTAGAPILKIERVVGGRGGGREREREMERGRKKRSIKKEILREREGEIERRM